LLGRLLLLLICNRLLLETLLLLFNSLLFGRLLLLLICNRLLLRLQLLPIGNRWESCSWDRW
jgi:hypothetical protein